MPIGVLILCTGNSARSVMVEAILNRRGKGRFRAYSAGSKPVGVVNPIGVKLLKFKGYDTSGFRSKSWDEFSGAGAPDVQIVITVCSNAAGETCPIWPGAPVQVHWGFPDPAAMTGSEENKLAAFSEIYDAIDAYITDLLALPVEAKSAPDLKAALQNIAIQHAGELL
ncbi:MAG: arsenate reductase ArsC [Kordiimonadaceae bacterium]|nr:arsenate reductase ArsC [Kordiimonadaceae bacterium]